MEDTHTAIIARLGEAYPIKGADFIHAIDVQIHGVTIATVVTGKDHTTGELGIYFSPDLQLSEAYCEANNLVAKYDEQGNKIAGTGFFNEKRRVTAQRFKGSKSEGLWMPLSSLDFVLDDTYYLAADEILNEGDKLTELNGIEICKRYPKAVTYSGATGTQVKRKELDVLNFDQHYDTAQLIHSLGDITRMGGAKLYITEKMHGTSHRVGYVPVRVQKNLSIWKRMWNAFSRFNGLENVYPDHVWEYRIVHGSRRVVLNDVNTGYYGSHDFRYSAVGTPELKENEVLYGEIVGWANITTPIMPPHNTSAIKEVKKMYGETMYYDYGLPKGESKFYIYRIRQLKDGIMQDLSYIDMVKRANELGYDVPKLVYVLDMNNRVDTGDVKQIADELAHGKNGIYIESNYGNHISEGVVLLFEKDGRIVAYKHKSYSFKVFEGILTEVMPEADSDDT